MNYSIVRTFFVLLPGLHAPYLKATGALLNAASLSLSLSHTLYLYIDISIYVSLGMSVL